MQNFQNDLQNLEMDPYQVGELTPISYQRRSARVWCRYGGLVLRRLWTLRRL